MQRLRVYASLNVLEDEGTEVVPTRLVIDLDGAGAGTQTYSLHLQNVAYNPANTHTLFGV